jgi:hypothetical protein
MGVRADALVATLTGCIRDRVNLIHHPATRMLLWHCSVFFSSVESRIALDSCSFVVDTHISGPLWSPPPVAEFSIHRIHHRPVLVIVFRRHGYRSFQMEMSISPVRLIFRRSNHRRRHCKDGERRRAVDTFANGNTALLVTVCVYFSAAMPESFPDFCRKSSPSGRRPCLTCHYLP